MRYYRTFGGPITSTGEVGIRMEIWHVQGPQRTVEYSPTRTTKKTRKPRKKQEKIKTIKDQMKDIP